MTTNMIDHPFACNGGGVVLTGVSYVLAGLAAKNIKVRGAGGGNDVGVLAMHGCTGWGLANLDVAHSAGTAGPLLLDLEGGGAGAGGTYNIHRVLAGTDTLPAAPLMQYDGIASVIAEPAEALLVSDVFLPGNSEFYWTDPTDTRMSTPSLVDNMVLPNGWQRVHYADFQVSDCRMDGSAELILLDLAPANNLVLSGA
jgi:hypothetical protein